MATDFRKFCNCGLHGNFYTLQTGDFFGGILNPFFTLIGLVFVAITIRQNQNALEQSEEELRLSREEMQKTNAFLNKQVITTEKQRFETTFFNLLSLFNETKRPLSGNLFVNWTLDAEKKQYALSFVNLYSYNKKNDNMNDIESICTYYRGSLHSQYKHIITPYLSAFYKVILFIDEADDKFLNIENLKENKEFYADLVRNQLSGPELYILFYECFLLFTSKEINGEFNFLSLIKKYDLLKILPTQDDYSPPQQHRDLLNTLFS